MNGRLLIVDDDPAMGRLLHDDLARRGHEGITHTSAEAAFEQFLREEFDTVITDLKMPGLDGIEFCRRLVENRPDVPVIVITAFGSLDAAVEAIRAGAYDFVTKPIERDMLAIAVNRALQYRDLHEQVRRLREADTQSAQFHEFVGNSPVMRRLFDQIDRLADHEVPVLITGESGTGKELVARALHRHSGRRAGPFVAVNCAALPESLLESELFGHVKGAFTGAGEDRQGLIARADGGTLFLDEVGELPLPLQPKLLRTLETGAVRPVGADRDHHCDIRLISATNRDLADAVDRQTFREDLYYRINVVHLYVPPLRSRGTDVLRLAQHFLDEITERTGKPIRGLAPAVAEKLLAYRWPGNVRELRNAIERSVALARFETLAVEDLPEAVREYRGSRVVFGGEDPEALLSLEQVERVYVEHVLQTVEGNKSLAARILGLDRTTLYRKLERWAAESDHAPV